MLGIPIFQNELIVSATVVSVSKSVVSYQVHMWLTKKSFTTFSLVYPFSFTSCRRCQ